MAVNKNFVVKNGLEVNTNLIVADTDSQKVGIGTTISSYLLHVYQGTGIGASSVYVTGISTVAQEFNVGLGGSVFTVLGNAEGTAGIGQSVGVGTGEPGYLLDVRSPVSTGQTALYVQGDMYVTGDINLDDITLDQLKVTGISTFIGLSTFASGISVLGLGATTTTLDVTGVSTFTGSIDANGDVDIDGHTELDDVQVSGIATITNTTQASNKDNGALVVEGGAGIEKNLFVGGGAEITGITTLTNTVDINDSVEIAGITTVQDTTDSDSKDTGALVVEGGVGIEKNLRVGAGLSVAGVSTFVGVGTFISDLYVGGDLYIADDITLDTNLNILGIATIGTLDVTNYTTLGLGLEVSGYGSTTTTLSVSGVSTFTGDIDANGGLDVDGHTELDDVNVSGASTFVGVGTFQSDLYVGGDLYISEDVVLDTNLNILGIATIGTLDVTNYSDFGLGIDVAGYGVTSTTLNVSGVSTFTGSIDANGDVDIDGHTELDDVNVSGFSTFASLVDINDYVTISDGLDVAGAGSTTTTLTVSGISTFTGDIDANGSIDVDGHTELDDLRVAGVSTFVGIGTFENDLFVAGNLNVIGDIVYDEVTGRNIDITGIATIGTTLDVNGDLDVDGHTELDNLNVAGFSTFVGFSTFNDYVFIQDGLNVAGPSTSNSYTINGTQVISSGRELQNIASLDATTTATIESAIANAPNTFTDLRVSGVSTFIGLSTFAGGAEFQGVGATSTTLTVSGVSTFTGTADFNGDIDVDGHTELDNLNVAGFSTFVGFATFQDYVFIQDGLNVTGVVTATSFSGDGSSLTGTATGLNAAVGVSSEGTFIGAGATIINFASTSGGAMNVTVSGGIATATVTAGVSIGLAIALGG